MAHETIHVCGKEEKADGGGRSKSEEFNKRGGGRGGGRGARGRSLKGLLSS